ncbi:phenylalanine--tRNA ligase subunit alpha [Verminephrobacter aporrectodeae]|uniref:Phenylalanine--tRNA ligase alpha subunit n=1 Tax=Verminephrobacter aporrectodeae subsp. tuberculatae TaxID=1110392 RepID=A0ABT3KPK6_9BURK|nr:phenylalanine--tRNA ligase subunit alpha [Verminephrobacter aporrectodeae]MCW5320246.1 phenylalanine--tRNA ligase subunit alpha [Verminephrobacter aporrectodeae subsp. tuberculatae]MCW8174833.1 phenylalanine--tRNA ligase subunit alpha [Verminephrobacter aporrectodeae subsp. tuberculatae]MCW8202425.1 phenylalanine--tRNA ligase subunit alpha [Verminephrobacter aporrectodeae subsp. tuberculatae]MCW8206129.1 phenylalanine--tRNA ligase subunit alpha [Verminephrobacter aporrectodeae subsp. tubercu
MNELDSLVESAVQRFAQSATPADLENAKAQFLGRSGRVTEFMKGLAQLGVEEKKARGAAINAAKQAIEAALNARRQALADAELQAQLEAEALDVSLPGRQRGPGGLHPVSLTLERIQGIFGSMGFDVAEGPEIETDWFNFSALNTPEDHPARSMHDTFYVEGGSAGAPNLLRTHTSPMQIRHALQHVKKHRAALDAGQSIPEIRVIAPGRTYRVDSDATHSPMFHQCEGLWIGENVSFKDLKVVFTDFCRTFFEHEDLVLRFRPSFFPFTEPSAEIDIRFQTGPLAGRWLEVAGSGQVHPNVVRNMGLDPEKHIGFAFGMGPDRLSMLRYGVNDLRLFFDGDIRFLSQFQ